jgi:hypothetical protein
MMYMIKRIIGKLLVMNLIRLLKILIQGLQRFEKFLFMVVYNKLVFVPYYQSLGKE